MGGIVSKVPSIDYTKAVKALQKSGFVVVRQKGGHIRLQKRTEEDVINITVPAHKPIKRSTLSHIIKDAGLILDEFLELL